MCARSQLSQRIVCVSLFAIALIAALAAYPNINSGMTINESFATKLNATGNTLVHSTHLGRGQGDSDAANCIAVDSIDNANEKRPGALPEPFLNRSVNRVGQTSPSNSATTTPAGGALAAALSVMTTPLARDTVGAWYQAGPSASDGQTPYTWSVSDSPATPALSGTLTPAAPSCTIAAGASSCNVTLTWTTTNPVGTSAVTSNYPSANTTVFTGNNGTGSASVSRVGRSFFLYNNAVLLAQSSATASCVSGTTWTGSVCAAPMSGTLTLSASSCSIPAGASSCNISLTWTTTNPVGMSGVRTDYPSANTVVANGNNGGPFTASVHHGGQTFYLYNNGIELAKRAATSSCASGTTWNGSVCQANMTGTLTPAAPSCTIAAGNSTCNVTLTWTTTNPVGTSAVTSNYPNASTPVGSGNNSSTTTYVPHAGRSFFLYNNGVLLDTSVATANCASGTTWTGSVCQPNLSGTLTPAAPSCIIAAGASSCNVTLTWTTTNPVGVSAITSNTPSANFTLFTGNNSTGSAPVFYPSRTFFLYNNELELDRSVATASCASGTTWTGSKCQAPSPMSGTLTLSASSCIIPAGASGCDVSLTWTTTNPVGVSGVRTDYPTQSFWLADNNDGGPLTASVHYGGQTFYLYNNAIELASRAATASCTSGTGWNGSTCGVPTATTQAATNISQTSFVMNGAINPNGVTTQGYFEWGTNPTLNPFTTTSPANIGGTSAVSMTFTVNGGACNAVYYYRVVAVPTGGSPVRGSIRTVTTSACATPTATTQAASNISQTSFVMNGAINPNGVATQVYFEWSTIPTLSPFITTNATTSLGTSSVSRTATLNGRLCNTTQYYRVVAVPTGGSPVRGSIVPVTTAACNAASCDIPDLTVLTGQALEFDEYSMSHDGHSIIMSKPGGGEIDSKISCLSNAVTQAGGTFELTSQWRPVGYQNHFVELIDSYKLHNSEGNHNPGCQALKAEIKNHYDTHELGTKICRDGESCPHPEGRAFDASILGIADTDLNNLAAQCNLNRPVANDGDGVHFELIKRPVLTSLSPTTSGSRTSALVITVNGNNFSTGAVVRWNGQNRITQFQSKQILVVTIPASDLNTPGTIPIEVFNDYSIGNDGRSGTKNFVVTGQSLAAEFDSAATPTNQSSSSTNTGVTVIARKELVGSDYRFTYRVMNNGDRPVSELSIGVDNQGNAILGFAPVGWNHIDGSIPASSYSSPSGWEFSLMTDTGTDSKALLWATQESQNHIPTGTELSGFSVLVPMDDLAYFGTFSAALDNGSIITGTVTVEDGPTPTTGNYPNASIALSGNTTVTHDGPPTNSIYATATTTADFKGRLEADPTTGTVRVTNAHPAGAYLVTVTAYDSLGATAKTFVLTVTTPVACDTFGPTAFLTTASSGVGSGVYSVAVGDFNGDGKQDIVTANQGGNSVSVLLRNAANTGFDPKADFPVGGGPDSVAVGDINGDGKQDIVAANTNPDSVSVLLRNAANTGFDVQVSFLVGRSPIAVAVGDFNGDRKQDIVTANANGNSVSVLLRNAANTGFDPKVDLEVGNLAQSVAVGDFNGDGKQDIVTANYTSNSVSVLLRNAANTGFDAQAQFAVGTNPASVAVGDFNGDNKQDIVASNNNSPNVSVLLRNAANTGFDPKVDLEVGNLAQSVAVGDFNGDGKQDIVAGNYGPNTVSVLLRNAANTAFAPKITFAVGAVGILFSVAVGDLNGDNRQDIVAAVNGANAVSVLQGNCNAAPCSYSISPANTTFTATGGSGSVSLTAGSGCSWTAQSNATWITITSPTTGTGNKSITYNVQADTGTTSRTGTLTVAGKTFTVTQAEPSTATYTISGKITLTGTTTGLGGVTVKLTSPTPAGFAQRIFTTTNTGTYSFTGLPAGRTYKVRPVKTGYAFTLPVRSYSNLGANQTAANFTAAKVYSISGRVTRIDTTTGISAVKITITSPTPSGFAARSVLTNSLGNYTLLNLPADRNYTFQPTKTGFTFAPPMSSITNLSNNVPVGASTSFTGTGP